MHKYINDAGYRVTKMVNGKQVITCLFYKRWMGMLTRAYSPAFHKLNPGYKGCSVCEEWKSFTKFKEWMKAQDWQGNELDKDIISPGNKIYSPAFCCFVDKSTNNLFTDNKARRGKYPVGVCSLRRKGPDVYSSQCKDGKGNPSYLGIHETVAEARSAYLIFKMGIVRRVADRQTDTRVSIALLKRAASMELELNPTKL